MFAIFPWDSGEKLYWVNPENGIEWYLDKSTTEYCYADRNENPKLNAVCFYVCENIDGKINCLSRILIDRETNKILAEDTSLEGIACKIDMLRFIKIKKERYLWIKYLTDSYVVKI